MALSSTAATPLTPRQREVLLFIQNHVDRHGYPPTSRELSDGCNLGGPSGAVRFLAALERKGYVHRATGRNRALVLVTPELDCSQLTDEDRFLVSATAEAQAVARDCVLAVAALTKDPAIKGVLIRDAADRHTEVIQIEEALARSSCGRPGSDGAMGAVLAALRSDLTWPTFVVDHLVYNWGAAQGSRVLADRNLGLQAVFESGAATCERAVDASVAWLEQIVDQSTEDQIGALRLRAEFMMKVCTFAARAIERPGGSRKFTGVSYSGLPSVISPDSRQRS